MHIQQLAARNLQIANLYIVDERRDGGGVGLVDACLGAGYARLKWRLGNRRPEWVFLTHWHCDHVGWLPQIIADYAPTIYCSAETASYLREEKTWRESPFWQAAGPGWVKPLWGAVFTLWPVPHIENVVVVEPDDWLNFSGREWAVVDLPGHTLGSVGLYDPTEGVLFSGDAVFRHASGRLREAFYPLAEDRRCAAETFRRVQAMGLWAIYPGHSSCGPVRAT